MSRSDLATLRRRHDELAEIVSTTAPDPQPETKVALAKTKAITTYPTTAAAVYAFDFCNPSCDEGEGNAVTFPAASGGGFAANMGAAVPPAGTVLLVTLAGSRWVFRWD